MNAVLCLFGERRASDGSVHHQRGRERSLTTTKRPRPREFLHLKKRRDERRVHESESGCDIYQTGSHSAQVTVPLHATVRPRYPTYPIRFSKLISDHVLPSKAAPAPAPTPTPGKTGRTVPEGRGGLTANNLFNREDRLERRRSKDPMKLDIRGTMRAPPTSRPNDVPETRMVFSAAAATSGAGRSGSGNAATLRLTSCCGPRGSTSPPPSWWWWWSPSTLALTLMRRKGSSSLTRKRARCMS